MHPFKKYVNDWQNAKVQWTELKLGLMHKDSLYVTCGKKKSQFKLVWWVPCQLLKEHGIASNWVGITSYRACTKESIWEKKEKYVQYRHPLEDLLFKNGWTFWINRQCIKK